jgi:predicted GIY-YIG superfamily endonuclease
MKESSSLWVRLRVGPFCVYTLSHPDVDGFYVGQTCDPKSRIVQHRSPRSGQKTAIHQAAYNGDRSALKMVVVGKFEDRRSALDFESWLQSAANDAGITVHGLADTARARMRKEKARV